MKADGGPIEKFDERLGQHMLSRMLLHVIRTAGRIDSPVNRRAGNSSLNNVDDVPAGLIFQAVDERHAINRPQIVRLAARRGIERRLVENDAEPVTDGFGFDDVRVELEQIRIVIVESLGFHSVQFTVAGGAGT